MTAKEEAMMRLKKSIERKKEWERKFEERFAGVDNIYQALQTV